MCEAVEADEAPTVEGGQGGHEDFVLKSSNEDRRVHLILLINSPFASNIHAKTNFIPINTQYRLKSRIEKVFVLKFIFSTCCLAIEMSE